MKSLRQEARGRECQIRLPCCNFNPETTVLAHFRLIGITGMGFKRDSDWLGSWACSDCHRTVDSDKSPEVQLAFAHGVMRTQAILREENKIVVSTK